MFNGQTQISNKMIITIKGHINYLKEP